MMFATRLQMSDVDFESIDLVYLPDVIAEAESCAGAPPAFGGPEGH